MPSRNEQLPATPPAGAGPRNSVAAPHKRGKDFEPLVVSPKEAGKLLNKGHQKIYDLIGSGELESYIDADGRARNITMASIKGYIARRLEMTKRGEGLTSPPQRQMLPAPLSRGMQPMEGRMPSGPREQNPRQSNRSGSHDRSTCTSGAAVR